MEVTQELKTSDQGQDRSKEAEKKKKKEVGRQTVKQSKEETRRGGY